jgi:hypothetical protein
LRATEGSAAISWEVVEIATLRDDNILSVILGGYHRLTSRLLLAILGSTDEGASVGHHMPGLSF